MCALLLLKQFVLKASQDFSYGDLEKAVLIGPEKCENEVQTLV